MEILKLTLRCYNNHREPLDPLDYISKPGNVKPIIKIRGLYLGGRICIYSVQNCSVNL